MIKEKEVLDYLLEMSRKYMLCSPIDRDKIENSVRTYLYNLPDELYLKFSNGSASNLCKHGYFESDLNNTIYIFRSMTTHFSSAVMRR